MKCRLSASLSGAGLGLLLGSGMVSAAELKVDPQALAPATLVQAFRPLSELQVVPRSQATGWVKSVGMIRNPAYTHPATGFLINKCVTGISSSYILTNYHVARGKGPVPSVRDTLTFSAGQGDAAHDYFATTVPVHPVAGGWMPLPANKDRPCADDWTLLRADSCLEGYDPVEISDRTNLDILHAETKVSMAGYSDFNDVGAGFHVPQMDYKHGVIVERECPGNAGVDSTITGQIVEDELAYNCSVFNGGSGSVVVAPESDGRMTAVAMKCGSMFPISEGPLQLQHGRIRNWGDQMHYTVGVMLSSIKPRLAALIQSDEERIASAPR